MEQEINFFSKEKEDKELSYKGSIKQDTLKLIEEETKRQLEGISEFHGLGHTELVAKFSKVIALGENQDSTLAEAAAWTHDWGRVKEKSDPQKRPHAELSALVSKEFYRKLYEENKITPQQYGEIQRAVKLHSLSGETIRETLKIVRDSDKLSRFGPLGIYHNVLGLIEEMVPFYIESEEIIRPEDAPIMERKDAKSVISMLNFCYDWKKMLETESAKKIMGKLDANYKAFLELFLNHKDMTDGKFWISFLREAADNFRKEESEFQNKLSKKNNRADFEAWLEFYETAADSEIFSEKNFRTFLRETK